MAGQSTLQSLVQIRISRDHNDTIAMPCLL
jgi:hypothetical protein